MSNSHLRLKKARRARDHLHDWREAQQHKNATASVATGPGYMEWRRPPANTLKCNVDAARYVDHNMFCIGACVRDEHGRFIKAFAKRYIGTPEVHEAKALGILESLKWLQSMNMC
ncbi:cytochrome P450, partial [Trifolium medium]|nr:cytochrome P450 [Trifolium medium]